MPTKTLFTKAGSQSEGCSLWNPDIVESIEIARNSLSVEDGANGNEVNIQRGPIENIRETLSSSHVHMEQAQKLINNYMPKKYDDIEIISTAFSGHNAKKLEISNKIKTKSIPLKKSLLNNCWVKE